MASLAARRGRRSRSGGSRRNALARLPRRRSRDPRTQPPRRGRAFAGKDSLGPGSPRGPSAGRARRSHGPARSDEPPAASDSPPRRRARGSARPVAVRPPSWRAPGSHPTSGHADRSGAPYRPRARRRCPRRCARRAWSAPRSHRCPCDRAAPRRNPPPRRPAPRWTRSSARARVPWLRPSRPPWALGSVGTRTLRPPRAAALRPPRAAAGALGGATAARALVLPRRRLAVLGRPGLAAFALSLRSLHEIAHEPATRLVALL